MIVQQTGLIDSLAGLLSGRQKKKKAAVMAAVNAEASYKDRMQTSFPIPKPANDNTKILLLKLTKAEARKDVQMILAKYGSIPSQDKLALYWGRPKGTVSKWMKEWESVGLIQRTRVQKRKMIS
jgi:hypothetical protein